VVPEEIKSTWIIVEELKGTSKVVKLAVNCFDINAVMKFCKAFKLKTPLLGKYVSGSECW
jgi:hypothetical protein